MRQLGASGAAVQQAKHCCGARAMANRQSGGDAAAAALSLPAAMPVATAAIRSEISPTAAIRNRAELKSSVRVAGTKSRPLSAAAKALLACREGSEITDEIVVARSRPAFTETNETGHCPPCGSRLTRSRRVRQTVEGDACKVARLSCGHPHREPTKPRAAPARSALGRNLVAALGDHCASAARGRSFENAAPATRSTAPRAATSSPGAGKDRNEKPVGTSNVIARGRRPSS